MWITQGCASARGMGQQLALEHRALLSRVTRRGGGQAGKGCLDSWSWETQQNSRPRIQGRGRSTTWAQHKAARDDGERLQPGAAHELLPCMSGWGAFMRQGMDEPGAEPEQRKQLLSSTTSPLTVSLLASTWHCFFLQQTKRHATCTLESLSTSTSVPDPPAFPTPPINKLQFPPWGSALGIILTSSGKGSSPGIPYE